MISAEPTQAELADEMARERGYAGYLHAPGYAQGDIEAALTARGVYL